MKALVIGLGIGNLYCSVLKNLNYQVDTVDLDSSKNPTFNSVDQVTDNYVIAVICTPNFTHEECARAISNKCKIVLIEKPGVINSTSWKTLHNDFPNTRFMMIKNNQYRESIDYFRQLVEKSKVIKLIWNNKNRIPNPGSWFTTKKLAFGGVSRDLIPHMLSYLCVLGNYKDASKYHTFVARQHSLEKIDSTDYGIVNKAGTYDVDDVCELKYQVDEKFWIFKADWKSDVADDVYIQFDDDTKISLGLCPEEAYQKMISTAFENLNNNKFWEDQLDQDMWIHKTIEAL